MDDTGLPCGRELYCGTGGCEGHYRRRLRGIAAGQPWKIWAYAPDARCAEKIGDSACDRTRFANDLCQLHYNRQRDGSDMRAPILKAESVVDGCKKCKGCGAVKAVIEFGQRKSGRIPAQCLSCLAKVSLIKNRKARAENPRAHKGQMLKYAYGMTIADYDAMLREQQGVCAICGDSCKSGRQLSVDHDHNCCPTDRVNTKTCGKCVRGLLCGNCNKGLGSFQENIESLDSAASYILSTRDILRPMLKAAVAMEGR